MKGYKRMIVNVVRKTMIVEYLLTFDNVHLDNQSRGGIGICELDAFVR